MKHKTIQIYIALILLFIAIIISILLFKVNKIETMLDKAYITTEDTNIFTWIINE